MRIEIEVTRRRHTGACAALAALLREKGHDVAITGLMDTPPTWVAWMHGGAAPIGWGLASGPEDAAALVAAADAAGVTRLVLQPQASGR